MSLFLVGTAIVWLRADGNAQCIYLGLLQKDFEDGKISIGKRK